MPKKIAQCRICGSSELVSILNLGIQELTGVFPKTVDQPVSSGPLELVKCSGKDSCGLLQLAHSFDSSEMYGLNYGYRSGLNKSMVTHLGEKVQKLLAQYAPAEKSLVLDIGSNDGTSLSFYPATLRRVGMDPTAAKFLSHYQKGIEVVPDFFSRDRFFQEFGGQRAAIITSIAMFYDLDDPISFMRQVHGALADDGIWHFEQSYMPTMLAQNAYDTICHEHLEYYSLRQIEWMTSRCGLRILDVELNDINGGSFALTVCRENAPHRANEERVKAVLENERGLRLDELEIYENFRLRIAEHRDALKETLANFKRDGSLVLGYGASTKGNVILQYCGFTPEDIPAIAEVNPDKFGSFAPGTRIPIISEAEAHARHPAYLLVLPWHFRKNLIARESDYLAGGGRLVFPLPSIETYPA
jgi:hypothetical protein